MYFVVSVRLLIIVFAVRGVVELDGIHNPHVRHAVVRLVVLRAQLRVRRTSRRAVRRTVPHHVGDGRELDDRRRVHR